MTSKWEKRGSYIATFLKQGEYLQQTENVNVKKKKEKDKRVSCSSSRRASIFAHSDNSVVSFPFYDLIPNWSPLRTFLLWLEGGTSSFYFCPVPSSRTDLHLQVSQEATWWINSGDLLPPVPFVSMSPPLFSHQCGWRTRKGNSWFLFGPLSHWHLPSLVADPSHFFRRATATTSTRRTDIPRFGAKPPSVNERTGFTWNLGVSPFFFPSMVLLWSKLMV